VRLGARLPVALRPVGQRHRLGALLVQGLAASRGDASHRTEARWGHDEGFAVAGRAHVRVCRRRLEEVVVRVVAVAVRFERRRHVAGVERPRPFSF